MSSGCIRLTNEDVIDLYNRVRIGATVTPYKARAAQMREPWPSDAALDRP